MENIIEASNLRFSYGPKQVLHNLNFQIYAGQVVGIIGENGAGKTTLLKILQGVLPAEGTFTLFGHNPKALQVKTQLGVMPQENVVMPGVTVRELLIDLAAYYENSNNVDGLLDENRLSELSNHRINSLSGGQLRRVTFLTALVGNPKLLFLDEPTVGMDVSARAKFWATIEKLRSAGTTIIITSHYLEELQEVASRLLILHSGEVAFDGTLSELQQKHHRTIFTFTTVLPEIQLRQLPGVIELSKSENDYKLISENGDQTLTGLTPMMDQIQNLMVVRESLATILSEIMQGESK